MLWRSFVNQEISFSAKTKTMIELVKVIDPEIQSRFFGATLSSAIFRNFKNADDFDFSRLFCSKGLFLAYAKPNTAKIH